MTAEVKKNARKKRRKWCIYLMRDPDGAARYVGVTTCGIGRRFRQHIRDGRKSTSRKGQWIKDLSVQGSLPVIEVIQTGSGEGWSTAERLWIAHYLNLGARLVNTTHGGEGVFKQRKIPRSLPGIRRVALWMQQCLEGRPITLFDVVEGFGELIEKAASRNRPETPAYPPNVPEAR